MAKTMAALRAMYYGTPPGMVKRKRPSTYFNFPTPAEKKKAEIEGIQLAGSSKDQLTDLKGGDYTEVNKLLKRMRPGQRGK